jgi:hypothetical protein
MRQFQRHTTAKRHVGLCLSLKLAFTAAASIRHAINKPKFHS